MVILGMQVHRQLVQQPLQAISHLPFILSAGMAPCSPGSFRKDLSTRHHNKASQALSLQRQGSENRMMASQAVQLQGPLPRRVSLWIPGTAWILEHLQLKQLLRQLLGIHGQVQLQAMRTPGLYTNCNAQTKTALLHLANCSRVHMNVIFSLHCTVVQQTAASILTSTSASWPLKTVAVLMKNADYMPLRGGFRRVAACLRSWMALPLRQQEELPAERGKADCSRLSSRHRHTCGSIQQRFV